MTTTKGRKLSADAREILETLERAQRKAYRKRTPPDGLGELQWQRAYGAECALFTLGESLRKRGFSLPKQRKGVHS